MRVAVGIGGMAVRLLHLLNISRQQFTASVETPGR